MTDATPVLLLMDFQNGIVDRIPDRSVVTAAARSAEAARAKGVPVMFVRVAFRPGYPEVSQNNLGFSAAAAHAGESMHEDNDGTRIIDALDVRPDEPVVTKRRVGAFSGSDLDTLLRAANADTLVLGGIATSGVVLSTLRLAADLDYRLVVLADACADADEEVHRVLMEKVFPKQATITTAEEWAAGL